MAVSAVESSLIQGGACISILKVRIWQLWLYVYVNRAYAALTSLLRSRRTYISAMIITCWWLRIHLSGIFSDRNSIAKHLCCTIIIIIIWFMVTHACYTKSKCLKWILHASIQTYICTHAQINWLSNVLECYKWHDLTSCRHVVPVLCTYYNILMLEVSRSNYFRSLAYYSTAWFKLYTRGYILTSINTFSLSNR